MKKHIVSSLLISLATALTLVPVSSKADTGKDFSADYFKDSILLEKADWQSVFNENCEFVFMSPNDNNGAIFYFVAPYPDSIEFTAHNELDENEIDAIIKNIDNRLILNVSKSSSADHFNYTITLKDENGEYIRIDSGTVKTLYSALSEKVDDFYYKYGRYTYNYGVCKYLTAYEQLSYDFSVEDTLKEFMFTSSIQAEIVVSDDGNLVYYVPNDELTALQHFELAHDIADSTGLRPHTVIPVELDKGICDKTVDVANAVIGDANGDQDVNMSDAISIIRYYANPDEFPLSEQGKFNADVVGDDGITNNDALAIQQYEAGIVDSLPAN